MSEKIRGMGGLFLRDDFFLCHRHQSTVISKLCDCGNRVSQHDVYSYGTAEGDWTSRLASKLYRVGIYAYEATNSARDVNSYFFGIFKKVFSIRTVIALITW